MTVLRREGRSLESCIVKAWTSLRKAAPRLLGAVLDPSTRTSLTSCLGDPFFDGQCGPKKSHKLSCNCHDDLVMFPSPCGHPPITSAESAVSLVGDRDRTRAHQQRRRLVLDQVGEHLD